MKALHLMALCAATSALLLSAASSVDAQQRPAGGAARTHFPSTHNFSWEREHGFHGGFGSVWVVEREVEVPVYVEVPVAAPATVTAPPAPPHQGEGDKRKPYVIGASYDSLPGSCMKLIEEGVSFFYCSGEWYRQVGEGRSATYRAVARKL